MPLQTLPIPEIALILIVLCAGIFYAYGKAGLLPTRKAILGYVVVSIALTLLSLTIVGSRGGLPPASVYGWPKEFLSVRNETWAYRAFYLCIDVLFYLVVAASAHAAWMTSGRRMVPTKKDLR